MSIDIGKLPESTIRVIDDDESFRTSMTRMLAASGLRVLGFRCAGDFLSSLDDDSPGCVLLDIAMPGLSGLDLMKALMLRESPMPIIFITGRDDVMTSVEAMKQGAIDYIVKPARAERVISAVRKAVILDAERRCAERELHELRSRFAHLTRAEAAVLFGVAGNKMNKQIAADLGVCVRTIKARRARMMDKLRLATVPELVKAAKLLEDADARMGASANRGEKVARHVRVHEAP